MYVPYIFTTPDSSLISIQSGLHPGQSVDVGSSRLRNSGISFDFVHHSRGVRITGELQLQANIIAVLDAKRDGRDLDVY